MRPTSLGTKKQDKSLSEAGAETFPRGKNVGRTIRDPPTTPLLTFLLLAQEDGL